MNNLFKFSIILLTTILLFSCHKDSEDSLKTNITIPGPEIITLINGDLDVYVTSLTGEALEDVDVFVYNEKLRTDKYGIAQFKNIPLDGNGTFVRALKEGFFFGSEKFFPSGTDNSIVIRLLPMDNAQEIDPSTVTEVAVEGGGSIQFQANSFVDANGDEYDGTVKVYATRINPEAPFSHEVMPGNLFGINDRGNAVALESFAMLAVELRDKDGGELDLANGKPATVKFVVDEKLQDAAPQFIPTWSFDEIQGNWIEEGEAEYIDGNYVAEVSHFSFWNCDAPFPLVNVTGTVVDTDGNPQVGFYVLVKVNGMCGAGYTNADGVFTGKMPKNQLLTFCVFAPGCDEPVFTTTVGPFTENTELEDFVLETSTAVYSGVVLCEGDPLANAEVYLSYPNLNTKYTTNEDGTFTINVQEINCIGIGEGTLFAINPATGIISEMVVVDENDQSGLELEVCVDCDVTPEIIQDNPDLCDNVTSLQVTIDNTSTIYDFQWSNGETSDLIEVTESGLYCVTITEPITECFLTVCEEVEFFGALTAGITGFYEIWCFEPAVLSVGITGGLEPYEIVWEGPAGTFNNVSTITVFEPGVYQVTIIDANGCEIILFQEVVQGGGTSELFIQFENGDQGIFCEGESITMYVDPNFFPIDTSQVLWNLPDGSSYVGGSLTTDLPGFYSVQYFDGICDYYGEVEVTQINTDYEQSSVGCDGYNYFINFESQQGGIQGFYSLDESQLLDSFPAAWEGNVQIEVGFACDVFVDYSIPYVTDGVYINSVSMATCDTCADGFIEFNFVDYQCNCTVFYSRVVKKGDLYNDLSAENQSQSLLPGEYYLLLTTEDECLVYSYAFEL